ncbi:MAG TPA: hypothetical protein VFA94_06935 [Acidimicrobiales bacterium]|nr:hypothetical protein [Acidimicrobiales bacterium]
MDALPTWVCPAGHVVTGAAACPVCGAVRADHDQALEAAVDRLLAAYQAARIRSAGQPWAYEVANDVCRSAAAAQAALKAARSPGADKVTSFLEGASHDDFYGKAAHALKGGVQAANAVGAVTGNAALQGVTVAGVLAVLVASIAAGYAAAALVTAYVITLAPTGAVVSQTPRVVKNLSESLTRSLQRPNDGRQLVDELLVPAERKLFALAPGHAPVLRTSTATAALDKGVGAALYVAVLAGGAIGVAAQLAA